MVDYFSRIIAAVQLIITNVVFIHRYKKTFGFLQIWIKLQEYALTIKFVEKHFLFKNVRMVPNLCTI